jgi:hypothetical protein
VFQAIYLQNLDIRKVINSNIKVWVFENRKKSEKDQGPHVSLRHCLNGARSLASHTCNSYSAMRQWLKRCHGRRPRAMPRVPLSLFACCSGGLPSHSDSSSRHLTRSNSSTTDALPWRHRPLPRCLRPPTRSIDATPMTARVSTTFLNREPPTSTTGRRPSPLFPSGQAMPPWKLPSGEPPPSPVTKLGPPPDRPSLRPTAPPHCAAAHRNRCRRRASWRFPCLSLRPKGPVGWAVMAGKACGAVGLAHSNNANSYFPFRFIQFQFNSNPNL